MDPIAAPSEADGRIDPELVMLPVIVCAPDDSVPVVLKFSSPKEIEPSVSVILPVERVIVPSIDASSATVKSSVEVICSAETVPLEAIVKSFATYASATSVPCQTPEEIVPTASIWLSFAVVITVPVTSGKVMVLSAVGSDKDNVVSKSNLSEYKNAYKILTDSMDKLSIKTVIDFLNEKKLISK